MVGLAGSHGGGRTAAGIGSELRQLGNAVLDIAQQSLKTQRFAEVKHGVGTEGADITAAERCMADRRQFYVAQGLMYGPSATLPNHVDGIGWWVVLWNLGCESRFHISTSAAGAGQFAGGNGLESDLFTFRSGDALIFNGAPEHGAMHGMARVISGTCPDTFPSFMRDRRFSVQLRQN